MKLNNEQISQKLKDAGLKVTPQRHAILEAVYTLGNHPTAEQIIEYIRQKPSWNRNRNSLQCTGCYGGKQAGPTGENR